MFIFTTSMSPASFTLSIPRMLLRGGRKDPVSRYGTQRGRTATWSCVVSRYEGLDQVNAVRALAAYMGDVYVREPYGSGYWAHVDVSSLGIIHGERAVQVSLNVTKVEA